MIDVHCHILWGIDDASKNKESALDMIRVAKADGVSGIVATSHIKPPLYENDEIIIEKAIFNLKEAMKEINTDMDIYFGGENYLSTFTLPLLRSGKFVSYNHGKYMLVEFSWTKNIHDNPTYLLKQVIKEGYIPVIAHPERYQVVHEDYSLLSLWRDMGALLQVNRTSIFGLDKMKEANEIALRMLEDDLIDLVGSDAHRAYAPRLPKLSDIYRYIEERYGKERSELYFKINPRKILGIEKE